MTKRMPLPREARENMRKVRLFILAVKPNATKIELLASAQPPMHHSTFQFCHNGEMDIAQIGVVEPGRIQIEHPCTPTVWRYN